VPAKPAWYRNLPYVLEQLSQHPRPYVDRPTVELLLDVRRRRAQQIMAPCIVDWVGSNALADRDALIAHLQRIADADDGFYEMARRRKVASVIEGLRRDRIEKPQLLVEAPTAVINQEFANLPPGVNLEPGRITVDFANPQQGLEKLLALAMAISNDFEGFERCVSNTT
jgi:hypothetical protein